MTPERLPFTASAPLTMGVELELQLVHRRGCDLTRAASDLLALLARAPHPGEIKPEITESMIEASTGIHTQHGALLAELEAIRAALVAAAERLNVGACGGALSRR